MIVFNIFKTHFIILYKNVVEITGAYKLTQEVKRLLRTTGNLIMSNYGCNCHLCRRNGFYFTF